MPITADGVHMLRVAVLRLIEEISSPSPEGMDDENVRQIRALTAALIAALPAPQFSGPRSPAGMAAQASLPQIPR